MILFQCQTITAQRTFSISGFHHRATALIPQSLLSRFSGGSEEVPMLRSSLGSNLCSPPQKMAISKIGRPIQDRVWHSLSY
jgi:hypothetical protein